MKMIKMLGQLPSAIALCFCLLLAACGGQSSPSGNAPTFKIGGTVTGLSSGNTVTLQNNGSDTLSLNVDGSFNFATQVAYGGSYNVTVSAQPDNQFCSMDNTALAPVLSTSGKVQDNISTIGIACDNRVDLAQLYGRLSMDWFEGATAVSHYGVFSQADLGQNSYGPVLNGFLGSNTAWAISCSALDASASRYNPSYYVCMLVNQNEDAYLHAFQLASQQLSNGRYTYCAANVSASACADQLRAAPLNSLTGNVQTTPAGQVALPENTAIASARQSNHVFMNRIKALRLALQP